MADKPITNVEPLEPSRKPNARAADLPGKGVEHWVGQARQSVAKARELLKPVSKPRRGGEGV